MGGGTYVTGLEAWIGSACDVNFTTTTAVKGARLTILPCLFDMIAGRYYKVVSSRGSKIGLGQGSCSFVGVAVFVACGEAPKSSKWVVDEAKTNFVGRG